jgi:hypothetical protein
MSYTQDFTRIKILPNEIDEPKDIEKITKEEYVFKKDVTDVLPDSNEIYQFTTVKGLHEIDTTDVSDELEFETSFEGNEITDEDEKKISLKPTVSSPSTTSTQQATTEKVEIIIIEGEEYLTLPNNQTIQKPSYRNKLGNLSDNELVKHVKDIIHTQPNATKIDHSKILAEIRLFEVEGLQPTDDVDDEEEAEAFDTQYSR